MGDHIPSFIEVFERGNFPEIIDNLYEKIRQCIICPHRCLINRIENETGFCRSGVKMKISSYFSHFGEERPISGNYGSGTVFFSKCNMSCQYCQNYEISQLDSGREINHEELSKIFLHLQDIGCHNINLVSPTHYIAQIVKSLYLAVKKGLKIPIVYNSGGYDSVETLILLKGIIDIYMPDMKYGSNETGLKYSKVSKYSYYNRLAVKEMFDQVGLLKTDDKGIAFKGLLVRHLVLPGDLSGSKEVFKFISEEISPFTYVNILSQYHPSFNSYKFEFLKRNLKTKEYLQALKEAKDIGLILTDRKK